MQPLEEAHERNAGRRRFAADHDPVGIEEVAKRRTFPQELRRVDQLGAMADDRLERVAGTRHERGDERDGGPRVEFHVGQDLERPAQARNIAGSVFALRGFDAHDRDAGRSRGRFDPVRYLDAALHDVTLQRFGERGFAKRKRAAAQALAALFDRVAEPHVPAELREAGGVGDADAICPDDADRPRHRLQIAPFCDTTVRTVRSSSVPSKSGEARLI